MINTSHRIALLMIAIAGASPVDAHARPHFYQPVRYMSAASAAMGGVTLPIADELGNSLFNNPAALARNTKFRSEFLNLNIDANSSVLGNLGLESTKMFGLSGMEPQLVRNPNETFSAGIANLTAVQWGGLAVGILFQEQVRARSDGTTTQYHTTSHFIPAVGYGVALARGVVRLGYSLQYVNQASGTATGNSSFLEGLSDGRGLSHNASVNFVFPYTYQPTFSILGRNLFGTHFVGGHFLGRSKNAVGIIPDQPMSVDLAFNWMVRISGPTKSYWYLQYKDATSAYSMSTLDRINFGVDFGVSPSFDIRFGMNGFSGIHYTLGIGYRSKSSEINLSHYTEPDPLASDWDTRWALQYKIFFQDVNTRDREKK